MSCDMHRKNINMRTVRTVICIWYAIIGALMSIHGVTDAATAKKNVLFMLADDGGVYML